MASDEFAELGDKVRELLSVGTKNVLGRNASIKIKLVSKHLLCTHNSNACSSLT